MLGYVIVAAVILIGLGALAVMFAELLRESRRGNTYNTYNTYNRDARQVHVGGEYELAAGDNYSGAGRAQIANQHGHGC